jgi:hypothetical protein
MMQEIEEFTDERQKGWCIHCGTPISTVSTNWDHVPTKGFLDRPLPPHVPQVEVCKQCNSDFSLDEEYFIAFLSCVLSGSTVPEAQANPKIQRALARNPALVARLEASKQAYTTPSGEEKIIWQPESERINRVIVKNARGHAFFEFGEPMLHQPTYVSAIPLVLLTAEQRTEFERVGTSSWPEVGSRMMTRIASGADLDEGWVIVQDDVYRYAVVQEGTLMVRSVIHNYLATELFWE